MFKTTPWEVNQDLKNNGFDLKCYICLSIHSTVYHIFSIPHMPYYGGGLHDRAFITICQSLLPSLTTPVETV